MLHERKQNEVDMCFDQTRARATLPPTCCRHERTAGFGAKLTMGEGPMPNLDLLLYVRK